MRRSTTWLTLTGLALALATTACNGSPERRLHPVIAAPASHQRLRIHVENASDARAREAGETTVTGYTMNLRSTSAEALGRAGYTVVVDPREPRDLIAAIQSEPAPGEGRFGGLLTSITLRGRDGVVEQLSGRVDIDEHADIRAEQVVALIEAIGRSPKVGRFVANLPPAGLAEGEPSRSRGAGLTDGLESAKTPEEIKAALPLSGEWQVQVYRGMQILTGISDLGASGESYLDVHGYVYNRRYAEWRRFCVVKTRSLGLARVGVDADAGVLFVEGGAQNALRGKRVVSIDLATVSDDAVQVAR
jgi:hypothetical protein